MHKIILVTKILQEKVLMVFNKKILDALRKKLEDNHLDAAFIPLGINFRYLFGPPVEEPSERLLLGIIETDSDEVKLIVPKFESKRMLNHTGVEVHWTWEETENPYKILAGSLKKNVKTIGLGPKTKFEVYYQLQQALPKMKFVDMGNLINSLRATKDEQEIDFLQQASNKSGEIIIQILNELEVGVTEAEVRKLLLNELKSDPDQKPFALVQFGANSTLSHYTGGARKLKTNDVVLIDAGTNYKDYYGDITITCVFGKATKEFKKVFETVFIANQRAKEAVAENKVPADVDAAARNFISEKGYSKYFTHRTGHGLGLEIHEEPYIVGNNNRPLATGNAFTIEPGIYLPGKFGVRAEDNVIKTKDGYWSSKFPREEIMEL